MLSDCEVVPDAMSPRPTIVNISGLDPGNPQNTVKPTTPLTHAMSQRHRHADRRNVPRPSGASSSREDRPSGSTAVPDASPLIRAESYLPVPGSRVGGMR